MNQQLHERKQRVEQRLKKYGISNTTIQYLPYLDFDPTAFQQPTTVAKRVIILFALSHGVDGLFARRKAKRWLIKEQLWDIATPDEQAFLSAIFPSQDDKMSYSWNIEAAMVLNWALNKTNHLSEIVEEIAQSNFQDFWDSVPAVGKSTQAYIENACYRPLEEIFEENIVNELATSYFRDLLFSNAPDTTTINRGVSFERHKALNWVRQFSGIAEWNETDTST